jgi:hypothetical protein
MAPTQDELSYGNGIPMESWRHTCQMDLLISTTHAERGFEAVPSEVGGQEATWILWATAAGELMPAKAELEQQRAERLA